MGSPGTGRPLNFDIAGGVFGVPGALVFGGSPLFTYGDTRFCGLGWPI
jgi:hypothetical protein